MATTTKIVRATGINNSDAILLYQDCPIYAIGTVFVGSGNTCTVQYTLDDALREEYWFTLTDMGDLTGNADFTIVFPVKAVRLHQTAGSEISTLLLRQNDYAVNNS